MDFYTFKQEIEDYLPIDFYNEENNTYKIYLLDALTENWENEKYQFCILATNMLFMSYLYKGFWFLIDKNIEEVDKKISVNQKYKVCELYDLSDIPEKTFIEEYLPLYKIGKEKRKLIKMLIDARDSCAHANGEIVFDQEDLKSKFQEYYKAIKDVFNRHKHYFYTAFQDALNHYWRSELYSKTTYEFLDGFCSKEKVSIKELLELYSVLATITIPTDEDYVQKQLSVFLIKYYLSNRADGKIGYEIDNLKEEISKFCAANPLEIDRIVSRLNDESAVSVYPLITQDELDSIIKITESDPSTIRELSLADEMPPSLVDSIDLSKMSVKDISDRNAYLKATL